MAPSTTTPTATVAAAAPARTVRLFIDGTGRHVLLAEAGEDAVAFLSSLHAVFQEHPPSAAAGCFGNLATAEALLPRGAASSRALPPLASEPWGTDIMAWRLFRCAHLGCRCSDVASREAGSACPCDSPSCAAADARRDAELHFLEACFYLRPDGSYAGGAERRGDTFFRCRAGEERRGGTAAGDDFFPCRFRVTDERGVKCPLCGGLTTVEVKCAAPTTYAIMDDLAVRPVAAGLTGTALLSALGIVAADADNMHVETVPFGYKEGLSLLHAALNSKTALTDVFLPAVFPSARRSHRR